MQFLFTVADWRRSHATESSRRLPMILDCSPTLSRSGRRCRSAPASPGQVLSPAKQEGQQSFKIARSPLGEQEAGGSKRLGMAGLLVAESVTGAGILKRPHLPRDDEGAEMQGPGSSPMLADVAA